jgi:hypothetical protein
MPYLRSLFRPLRRLAIFIRFSTSTRYPGRTRFAIIFLSLAFLLCAAQLGLLLALGTKKLHARGPVSCLQFKNGNWSKDKVNLPVVWANQEVLDEEFEGGAVGSVL